MLEASLGLAQNHHHLTVFPILAEEGGAFPYLLMADALATGVLTIQEVGDGQVPLLQARNRALDPILILDGEQLVGARQNRMTNRTIILPPESVTRIPVSCMEQGRWHFVGDHFAAAPQHAPSKVRRKARETEARSAQRSRAAEARGHRVTPSYTELAGAQGDVWSEIRGVSENLGNHSSTGALNSVFEDRRSEMDVWIRAFSLIPRQVGLLAFLGAKPLGMDALGGAGHYATLHRRILTGYILDAMDARSLDDADAPVQQSEAEKFIEDTRSANRTRSESVGSGEYRILDGSVLGGELVDDGQLVHLSAFPNLDGTRHEGEGITPPTPLARPSHRRRRF